MIYFSYNDFVDCTENGDINEIKKVEENIVKYEIRNGINIKNRSTKQNQIIEILKQKTELKKFLNEFFNMYEIESIQNINYYNNIKSISDKEKNNNIICKIKDKEIFIFIKVIDSIDNNIPYKMFENSLNIIKKWNIEEKMQYKRYPIVIPIVIYIGEEKWNNSIISKANNKINYITYKDNKINFSYNFININNLRTKELEKMESKVSQELKKLKDKYLQIN